MRTSFFDAGGAFLTDTLKINDISKILADKNILNPFFKEIILNIISKYRNCFSAILVRHGSNWIHVTI